MMSTIGTVAVALAGSSSLAWLHRLPLWRGTLVLAYHRVLPDHSDTPLDQGVVSATRSSFVEQLRVLARHFDVVGTEALDAPDGRPSRRVVLTFDDGYRDNYDIAFPLLQEHGLPATFFLTTGFLDRPAVPWWDELAWMVRASPRAALEADEWLPAPVPLVADRRAAVTALTSLYKSLPTARTEAFLEHCAQVTAAGRCPDSLAQDLWMTWDMAAEMRDAGMGIGGHTVTHEVLARASEERQRAEIEGCQERLRDRLGVSMSSFAYPVGLRDAFDDRTRELLRRADVRHAFSLYGGMLRRAPDDPLDIPRASVGLVAGDAMWRAALALPARFARW
jgi:peptidoglycan/xylan/chitin deacetylase (PgdA/CDA1 family)